MSPRRIGWKDGDAYDVEIVAGKRSITADTALRLAGFFGTDAQSWMNLQTHYDLAVAEERLAEHMDKTVVAHRAV